MKTILMIAISTLMLSPAMAFEQTDLDQINSFQELQTVPEFDLEGFKGGKAVDDIFFGHRDFTCVAKNRRGRRFQTQGPNRVRVRRRALRQCRRHSLRPATCQIVRCERRNGKLDVLIDFIDLIDKLQNQ